MKGRAFLLLLLFLILLQPALAYDQHSTHPSLTYEMAQLFNAKNLDLNYYLLPNEIKWLKQGAIEEDEPARWINHFYDPVHNTGWTGKHLGDLSQEAGYKLGGDIAPRRSLAAIDWVTNQEYQAAYGRQYGNQTWQKAIRSYLDGDKKAAFFALGHVLHLVEDVTVPDHVRDDSHPGIEGDPGSPYEVFAKRETDKGELRTAEELLKNNKDFKKLSTVNQAIKDLAIYVNRNFFSEDTISSLEFQEPNLLILKEESRLINGFKKNFLVQNGKYLSVYKDSGHNRIYSTNDINFVLPSYRDHLFPEAVLTGASVINLFFQEVEKYKQNPDALEPIVPDSNVSLLVAFQQFPKRAVIKACGAISEALCKKTHNTLAAAASAIATTVHTVIVSVKNKFNTGTGSVAQNTDDQSEKVSRTPQVIMSSPELIKTVRANPPAQNTRVNKPRTKTVVSPQSAILGIKINTPLVDENQYAAISAPQVFHSLPAQAVYGGGAQGTLAPLASFVQGSAIQNSTPFIALPVPAAETNPAPSSTVDTPVPTAPVTIPTTTTTPATSTVPVEEVVDIFAPSVPVLTITNQSGASSTNIMVRIESQDAVSGVASFDLQVSTNTFNWLDLITSTTPTHPYPAQAGNANLEYNFTGTRGQSYYFKARATDLAGNISQWSAATSPTFVNWSGEVVINEIAWAGTSNSSATHEWFELYNNTNAPIDLSTWKVLISGREISISKFNKKIIEAKGYYLFERISDSTVVEIMADAIFGVSTGLGNSGEKIELIKPNGEKADEVNASGGWFAGDNILYRSMERISSTVSGNEASNWQSNQGLRETGRTFNGGPLYGSPKRANFGFINLNFDQAEEARTLTKANNPYILQYYSVPAGKTLRIEPGVIIKSYFNNSKIDVFGNLNAVGDTSENIIFTSGRDVSFEGNSNIIVGSWPTSSPMAQDWQGIWFKPGSVSKLDNILLRYAGKPFVVPPFALPVSRAMYVDKAVVDISESSFTYNGPLTLFSKEAITTIRQTNFSTGDRALQSENSFVSITDSAFSNFTNNSGPLFIKDRWPLLRGITYTDNALNMPYLEAVTIDNQEVVIDEEENYLVNVLKVAAGATLRILPGASLYIPIYGTLEIRGVLDAIGTSEKPINFLPYPTSVNWGSVRFYNSTSTLSHVYLKQGNRLHDRSESINGMILAADSNITISNSNLWDSEANAIQSTNSTLVISHTAIGVTTKVLNTRGIKASSGVVRLDTVSFDNVSIGIESGSSALPQLVVDMKNISSSSFSNVDYFWQPLNLWALPLSPLETI